MPFVLAVQHTSAADLRLRPLGHWDRSPDNPVRSECLYRLSYPGPRLGRKDIIFFAAASAHVTFTAVSRHVVMIVCYGNINTMRAVLD